MWDARQDLLYQVLFKEPHRTVPTQLGMPAGRERQPRSGHETCQDVIFDDVQSVFLALRQRDIPGISTVLVFNMRACAVLEKHINHAHVP